MRAYERLLGYVKVHTTSDESSETVPSTSRQFDLANMLADEMEQMGFDGVGVDEHCNVYGVLPPTDGCEDKPAIALISHLDTSPDASGENVKPVIWENYDGKDINFENGRVLSPEVFPELKKLAGRTLITSDGTTLLGADDKSGIAEILTMAEKLLENDLPHGKICVAFTPDEEIGHGAESLDLVRLGADYGYTVDGGAENEIEYENFNAAKAVFTITGKSVHPGEAKNKMVNASIVACEIVNMLPSAERPEHTEGREGFFHVTDINGNVEDAKVEFIIRDHSDEQFAAKQKTLCLIEKTLNEKYCDGTVELTITEQYRNMIEKIRPHMDIVENAKQAMTEAGLTPVEVPIRGGTDGAQLSFRGLPCPNLGTGGYAFHGPYEHITAEAMDTVVEVLIGIVKARP